MKKSPLTQQPLPFADTALAPTISAHTLSFHYGKHHKAYFDNMAKLIAGTPQADHSLEEVVMFAAKDAGRAGLFNNAAQCWNHNFYWHSLSPKQQMPSGKLLAAIDRDLGGFEAMKKTLAETTVSQFGSGWGWLVSEGGKLKITKTSNADLPMAHGQTALLTIDVWEHAYYLDWQNRRADHVNEIIAKHLNWDFATQNFEGH
ncbi:MAG TPA: superoxide dismutase [Fe] [Alphaproteobacteria bacterium]|nr:superoxide dismutase [Fe] [Alphaproteobacteria bacterium]